MGVTSLHRKIVIGGVWFYTIGSGLVYIGGKRCGCGCGLM